MLYNGGLSAQFLECSRLSCAAGSHSFQATLGRPYSAFSVEIFPESSLLIVMIVLEFSNAFYALILYIYQV